MYDDMHGELMNWPKNELYCIVWALFKYKNLNSFFLDTNYH